MLLRTWRGTAAATAWVMRKINNPPKKSLTLDTTTVRKLDAAALEGVAGAGSARTRCPSTMTGTVVDI